MPALGRSTAQGSKLRSGLQNWSTGSQSVGQDCVCMHACVRACLARHLRSRAGNRTFALAGSVGRDAVSRGWVTRMMSFLLLGSVTGQPEGQGRQAGRGRKRILWSEWAFTATACATEPQGPRWAGWAVRSFGLRPCHAAERISSPGLGGRQPCTEASLPRNSPRPL